MIIDGHLDIAMNAVLGRDLTLSLPELRARDTDPHIPMVSFPAMRAANVAACFGTLFAWPESGHLMSTPGGYTDAAGAYRLALAQLEQYQRWEDAGEIRILRSREDARAHFSGWSNHPDQPSPIGVVILMEGADPIRDPGQVDFWVREGLRMIGPAWGRTRYAGGTEAPGPLTDAGVDLMHAMRESGVTLDVSHLDDAAFWQAVDLQPKVIASHANSRNFVNTNRQLTDEMALRVAELGGLIGMVVFNKFLRQGWDHGDARLPMRDLTRLAEHFAGLVGWERVALGTDFDGGFGVPAAPVGIDDHAGLWRFLDTLPGEHRAGVAGQHWCAWLEANL